MKNVELNANYNYLSSCTLSSLSVDELTKLRRVRKVLGEKRSEYQEIRKSIWDSYGIKNEADRVKHEKREEVETKVKELDELPIEIEGLNFLTEQQVIECTPKEFNQSDLDRMMELLLKK